MIKCEVGGGECKLELDGNVVGLAAEVAALAGAVYSGVRKRSPAEAELFRAMLAVSLAPDSPAWNHTVTEGVSMVIPMRGNEDGG